MKEVEMYLRLLLSCSDADKRKQLQEELTKAMRKLK